MKIIYLSAVFMCIAFLCSAKEKANMEDLINPSDSCETITNFILKARELEKDKKLNSAISVLLEGETYGSKSCSSLLTLYLLKGDIYRVKGELDSSILEFERSANLVKTNREKASLYYNLGNTQLMSRMIEVAVINYKKSLHFTKIEKDTSLLIKLYNNLATAYRAGINADTAVTYYKRSLALNKGKFLDNWTRSIAQLEIGSAYFQNKSYDLAQSFLWRAMRSESMKNSLIANLSMNEKMGILKFMTGDMDSSYYYLNKLYDIQDTKENIQPEPSSLNFLAALELKYGTPEKTIEILTLTDSLFRKRIEDGQNTALLEAQAKFQLKESELEKENLAQEKKLVERTLSFQRTITYTFLAALIVSVFLIILVYLQRKKVSGLNTFLDQQNDELKKLIGEKDHFMGLLTHDLRSPVSSIVGNSDLMLETEISASNKNCLLDIKKSAFVSLQMMNQVLDIYRFETEQTETILTSLDLCQVIHHMVRRYEPLAAAKKQSLKMDCTDQILIKSNETLLKSILGNLLSNAIKYNYEGGDCQITTKLSDSKVRVQFSDNGPGFSVEEYDKVFGKFQKLSALPTGSESTSGLGLYMVKIMVSKVGGTVELAKYQEKGSTFIVELPR